MREKLIFVPLFLLISMGTTQAQVSYNQEFAPDVPTLEGFRTNRTSYSAIMDVLGRNRTQISAEKLEQLKSVPLDSSTGLNGSQWSFTRCIWSTTSRLFFVCVMR